MLANRVAWKDWGKSGQPMRERVSGLERWEICPHGATFPKKSQLVDALILPLLFLWGQNDFVGWVFLGGFFIFLKNKRASYLGEIFGHE